MFKGKHTTLSLSKKVKVIEEHEKNKQSIKFLVQKFKCRKRKFTTP